MLIISVGDVMLDIYIDEPVELNSDTDTVGRTSLRWGGSAANFAVWASRIGSGSAIVGRVGMDFVGKAALADFVSEGVNPLLSFDDDMPTGTVVVKSRGGSGREMICDRKANARLSETDLPISAIANASWVHISGYTVIEDVPRRAVRSCIKAARSAGVPVSVDPGSCSLIGSLGVERFLDAVRGTDLIVPNMEEAGLLTGYKDAEEAAAALLKAFPMVAVKLGASGAYFADRKGSCGFVPAPPADAVDVNGAGDSFGAAFVSKYLASGDKKAAAEAGCALGSLVAGARGARPALDLKEFLKEHFGRGEEGVRGL
ncbi:MAG TPA: sugar kinase [Bacillota bacterium]|nr:sugar kinase [Bacillota bacterium]